MKKTTKGMWTGAVVWVLGIPFLLALLFTSSSFLRGHPIFHAFICLYVFFGYATGLFALMMGAVMGHFISQWRQKNLNTARIFIRSAVVGAGLCVFVEWASIGFLYSFGAIARHLSIFNWLRAFWPWVVGFLPLALLIGAICGAITALLILYNNRNL